MTRSYEMSNNNNNNNSRDVESNNKPDKKSHPKCFEYLNCFGGKKKKGESGQNEIDLSKEVNIKEHLYPLDELCQKLGTDTEKGISDSEADLRHKRDGKNAFTPPKQTPGWVLFMREMTNGFAIIIWLSSLASFVCYGCDGTQQYLYLGVVLALVVLITGTYSYSQQASSGKIFASFKNMVPQQTIVIRGGNRKEVSAETLVVGDLVYCKSGDRVPADIRVIRCEGMKVDNSSLTGESDPLSRSPDVGHNNPLEARNLAFFSTNCVDGNGYGIVIAIGDNTVMGHIAKLVTGIENEKTPIAIEISRFTKIITCIAIFNGILFLVICLGFKLPFIEAFVLMIAIIVGNIPEGLLPALTVALTLTAKRIAAKNCLVKYLEAVETLGSTSTICSDKTGTLTQNRMTVEHCYLGAKIIRVSHVQAEVEEDMNPIKHCWEMYNRCCRLCSRSEFLDENPEILKRQVAGDASESAILKFMESVTDGKVTDYRNLWPKMAEKPFSSVYKYQYSIHRNPNADPKENNHFFLVMKGAPERIISLCSTILNANGETTKITPDDVEEFEEAYRELGSMGERVIAFCDMEFTQFPTDHKFDLENNTDFELDHFRFLGLVALIDPPRATVPDAVGKCRTAGIKVIMVTGDHPITAQAIAKAVGIFTESHRRSTRISHPTVDHVGRGNTASIVVPGDELAAMSDDHLKHILNDFREIVFARTSPQQKLRIVENCQALGQIVAVTGDGVNDSPALKKANIGVAMGITGSDVSKQAADMILLDDNFATIVTAVEEGRRIFDNMKKTISYILAGSVTTLYPFMVYVILGFPQAIGPITVLLIALGTDMMPAISLAYERAESDIMKLPPRNPKTDVLVTKNLLFRSYAQIGVIMASAGYLGYFVTMLHYGWKPWDLWQIPRTDWEADNFLMTDSFGEIWNTAERIELMTRAQSSYFICIVVCQWMDVIVSKTRRLSIFHQGMGNWVLNFSICFETALAVLFCYTPGLNTVLVLAPVIGWVWLAGVPFFFFILAYEELRKFLIRRDPDSFFAKELLI